jgi:hypothetical protein
MSSDGDMTPAGPRPIVRVIRLCLTLFAMVFLVGIAVGFWAGHSKQGGGSFSTAAIVVIGLWLLSIALLLIPAVRDIRALSASLTALPRRERVSLQFLGIATVVGLIGGVATFASNEAGWFINRSGALSPTVAVITSVLLATLAPWMTWRWWHAIDEHERSAYADGAQYAGHFALFAGMAWWVLARARLVPEPDVITLIIAMSFVWTGVWLRRRYF